MDARREGPLPEPPTPAPDARERALTAALRRFDEKFPQGSGRGARLKEAKPSGSYVMTRNQTALAASLAIFVGGPLAYMVARETRAPAPQPAEQTRTQAKDQPTREAEEPKPGHVQRADKPADDVVVALPEAAQPAEIARSVEQAGGRARQEAAEAPKQAAEARPADALVRPPAPPPSLAQVMPATPRPDGDIRMMRPAPSPMVAPPGVAGAAPRTTMRALDTTAPYLMRAPAEPSLQPAEPVGRDQFEGAKENGFKIVKEQPVSTFSIDVDTASYSFTRASLARNVLPQPASVRTEELINYFPYAYEGPASAGEPFKTNLSVFPSPWNEGRKIVQIGIKGYALQKAERPRANLVFLVDTSGSMNAPNRLPLVKQSLAMLVEQLGEKDRVAIVTYAGTAGTLLEPTAASEKGKILAAIEGLGAGGSTAGGEGIRQAYTLAERNFDGEAVNRVILATDGDFNVGITNRDELKGYVERQRGKGIFLSILGFGMGNYNDALMQVLAQNGNGAAAYIDTIGEARKVLVEEATSTLIPIAKDVKIQVEFNPATVQEYRLVGYETRLLAREDFNNDKIDAGDVGSGQSVTALYEIVPVGGAAAVGELRYGAPATAAAGDDAKAGEYGFVKIRYKLPKSDTSALISTPIARAGEASRFEDAPQEARFATAVAGFGELLRGGKHTGRLTYDDVVQAAQAARGDDPYGYRAEFVSLVRAAKTASAMQTLRR